MLPHPQASLTLLVLFSSSLLFQSRSYHISFPLSLYIMEKKALLLRILVILLLCLSCVVYAAAVPATRSSIIGKMVPPSVEGHLAKEDLAVGLRNNDQEVYDMEEEGVVESRMMMDIEDYPRTRPNPAHDPKSPGKP